MRPLPPLERELLLYCARTHVNTEVAGRIRELVRTEIDWAALFETAIGHGVAPLLCRTLSSVAGDAVPSPIWEQACERLHASALHSQFLADQLVGLAQLMKSEGLRALYFKGPTLAVAAYGDVTLREFHDLDVLVHRDEFPRTRQCLLAHGYKLAADHGWVASFVRRPVFVDLHQAVTPPAFPVGLDFERWWRRRQLMPLGIATVDTLSAEDLLVVLAIQAARDTWNGRLRLAELCDIAEVVRAPQGLNWAEINAEAARMRTRSMLTFGLRLTSDLLGIPVAGAAAWSVSRNSAIDSAVNEAHTVLFEKGVENDAARLPDAEFHALVRERLRDRLWPYWKNGSLCVQNEADYAFVRLPSWLSVLYYVIRPVRLICRHGRSILRIPMHRCNVPKILPHPTASRDSP